MLNQVFALIQIVGLIIYLQSVLIKIQKSMQESQDPRATVIKNLTEEQQLIDDVLKQIPAMEEIKFDLLMDVFQKCFEIREEPEFIEAIFNKNQIYEEFVMWIVDPITIIEKRQNTGAPVSEDFKRKYPYTCMKIARDNNLFYIHLYLKGYFDQKALRLWFQFLANSNVDTFYTSLGYFTEIMMPFLKYEFSQCTKICEELTESCGEDLLMCSSRIQRQQTQVGRQRLLMSNKKKQNSVQKQISILALFTDSLLEYIFAFIEYEAVFKFVHNLILVSLEQNDLKRSKRVFETFLRRALQKSKSQTEISNDRVSSQRMTSCMQRGPLLDTCVEYILQVVKQIYDNANTEKNYRVIFFIDSLVRLNIITIFIERIQHSPLLMLKQQCSSEDKISVSSTDLSLLVSEEEVLQYFIKTLSLMVKIFSKMGKFKKSEEQKERESRYYRESSSDEEDISGENKVMKEFSLQICCIFTKLPQLSQLVKRAQSRVIAFSSGQNIKPITMCKYEFFQLLYACLLLSKQFPESFVLDTEKINIFSIIERYLQENRWNNLGHKVLEKITCLLIINNKNFFRTKEMNKNNMADQFLNTIIESFTNKKHIFLKSLRFTTQGNLHTLYSIAKAIINKLKQTHNLANFVHQLDYYKKFVMNDLQQYENKFKQIQYPADEEDIIIDNKNAQQNDQLKLYIDELSVSEIVKKIDLVSKWPLKQTKKKHGSFIHRSLSYMSDQNNSNRSTLSRKKKPMPPSQRILNTEDEEDNDVINKIPSFSTGPRIMTKSQNGDSIKPSGDSRESAFFKHILKKTDSIIPSPPTIKHEGAGLFETQTLYPHFKDRTQIQLFCITASNTNKQIEEFKFSNEANNKEGMVLKKQSLNEQEGNYKFRDVNYNSSPNESTPQLSKQANKNTFIDQATGSSREDSVENTSSTQ